MSHLLKQCINFTNQIFNINYHKSLISRYNLTANKNITCLNYNKKKRMANSFRHLKSDIASIQALNVF